MNPKQEKIDITIEPSKVTKAIEKKLWAELISFAKRRKLNSLKMEYYNMDKSKTETVECPLDSKKSNELLFQNGNEWHELIYRLSGEGSLEVGNYGHQFSVSNATRSDEKEINKIFKRIGWKTKTFHNPRSIPGVNEHWIFSKETLFGLGINDISKKQRAEFNKGMLSLAFKCKLFNKYKALLKNSEILKGRLDGKSRNALSKLITNKAIDKIFFYSKLNPAFMIHEPDIVKVEIKKDILLSILKHGFSKYRVLLENGKFLDGEFNANRIDALLKIFSDKTVNKLFFYKEVEPYCIQYEPHIVKIENIEFDTLHLLTRITGRYCPRETTMRRYDGPIKKPREIIKE